MPQFHLLSWDDERRLSEHSSRRQRQLDPGAPCRSSPVPGTSLTLHPKIEDRDAFNPYSALEIGVGTQRFLSEEVPQRLMAVVSIKLRGSVTPGC